MFYYVPAAEKILQCQFTIFYTETQNFLQLLRHNFYFAFLKSVFRWLKFCLFKVRTNEIYVLPGYVRMFRSIFPIAFLYIQFPVQFVYMHVIDKTLLGTRNLNFGAFFRFKKNFFRCCNALRFYFVFSMILWT